MVCPSCTFSSASHSVVYWVVPICAYGSTANAPAAAGRSSAADKNRLPSRFVILFRIFKDTS